jgi:hypothetical protein
LAPKKNKILFSFYFWLNLSSKIFAKKIKVDAKISEKRSHEGSKLSCDKFLSNLGFYDLGFRALVDF